MNLFSNNEYTYNGITTQHTPTNRFPIYLIRNCNNNNKQLHMMNN